ncbi:ANTAR domain-containing protein OS=Streptomyces alboniger OX=132473 GN=CP975_12235 PE=4 SV=1 [Streptomyces alboniger]
MDQQLLAKTFVELADNLVADFDLIDFLRLLTDRCVGMLDASAAGVLLADRDGKLRVMAASDEQVRLLEELFQLQNDEGPCLECFRTGVPVIIHDLTREVARLAPLVTAAHRGLGAVQALPMRLRDETVGALNLFRAAPGPFDPPAALVAQALADIATISLLQQRTAHRGAAATSNCRPR